MAKSIIQGSKECFSFGDSMQEIWKDISGYEGLYQVSNLGRIKSLSRTIGNRYKCNIRNQKENRIIKPCKKDNQYLYVSLTKNRKRNNKYIHRLVAEAFLPRIDGKNVVNHKDYDVTNNAVENLEWVTQRENIKHSAINMQHSKDTKRKTATGFKYIGIRNNRYRVHIYTVKNGYFDKSYESLEEAIKKRNEVMNLWQIVSCKKKESVL